MKSAKLGDGASGVELGDRRIATDPSGRRTLSNFIGDSRAPKLPLK